jgi:type VI protein secretion system component VasK
MAKRLLVIFGVIAAAGVAIGAVDHFAPGGPWWLIGAIVALICILGTVWQGLEAAREEEQRAAQERDRRRKLRERMNALLSSIRQDRSERRKMSGRPDYEDRFSELGPHSELDDTGR